MYGGRGIACVEVCASVCVRIRLQKHARPCAQPRRAGCSVAMAKYKANRACPMTRCKNFSVCHQSFRTVKKKVKKKSFASLCSKCRKKAKAKVRREPRSAESRAYFSRFPHVRFPRRVSFLRTARVGLHPRMVSPAFQHEAAETSEHETRRCSTRRSTGAFCATQ